MIITKEMLKTEIDKVPERYLDVVYRIIRSLTLPFDSVLPAQKPSGDAPTAEQVVTKIQSLPKDPANIERATKSLAEALACPNGEPDPTFDVQEWNQQWDDFEAKMKQQELENEASEQELDG